MDNGALALQRSLVSTGEQHCALKAEGRFSRTLAATFHPDASVWTVARVCGHCGRCFFFSFSLLPMPMRIKISSDQVEAYVHENGPRPHAHDVRARSHAP